MPSKGSAPYARSKGRAPHVREVLIGAGALVLAVAALLFSWRIESAVRSHDIGPAAWPTALAACMVVLALLMLSRAAHLRRATQSDPAEADRTQPDPTQDSTQPDPTQDSIQSDPTQGSTQADSAEAVAAGGPAKVMIALAAFVGYGAAWQVLDFRVCTPVLLAVLAANGGGRGWRALIVFPIGLTALLWLLFGVLLEVPL
ncbi:tripartite tricarboxylate transporter TctB family protein [Nonomuraea sp. K274]|uniref:Tripartite tricarboxylate transporter TctB family protein n=1 Tax=Nonomuraea cypriaca TaxID=1187855 RepID=A0A931AA47_9ACTN|nr:tripartite tricarboxylate transporter TctB family protein [Nonomuraea cypriaca]MBF8185597.1 tripartite tricarboxylate transporter TctB family protein [Nonomuraea cypriaca]